MKKILFIILFLSSIAFSQVTGYLTTGDSVYVYYPNSIAEYDWIQIVLIDSATSSTADSMIIEIPNGYEGWTAINCKNLKTFTDGYVLVPGKDNSGIAYMIWYAKGRFRLRKTDVAQLTEKMYFTITEIKNR